MDTFYAIRYVPGVPLASRIHRNTLGRFTSWDEAESARQAQSNADLLEVVVRGGEQ